MTANLFVIAALAHAHTYMHRPAYYGSTNVHYPCPLLFVHVPVSGECILNSLTKCYPPPPHPLFTGATSNKRAQAVRQFSLLSAVLKCPLVAAGVLIIAA